MKNANKWSRGLFILGILTLLLAAWIPMDWLTISSGLRPMGLALIFICPLIGSVGMICAIIARKKWLILGHGLLILAFPIGMGLASWLNAK